MNRGEVGVDLLKPEKQTRHFDLQHYLTDCLVLEFVVQFSTAFVEITWISSCLDHALIELEERKIG